MTKSQIVSHFGSQRLAAEALGIRQASIAEWRENAVPGHWQLKVERITGGDLNASARAYDDVVRRVSRATAGLIRLSPQQVRKHAFARS